MFLFIVINNQDNIYYGNFGGECGTEVIYGKKRRPEQYFTSIFTNVFNIHKLSEKLNSRLFTNWFFSNLFSNKSSDLLKF